ncbi:MAG: YlxR family protein [Clostridia bacterium]|nr:YlxR family protein [Clostridia bacterium]
MKAPKKIPQRKCMGCMESRNKSELIRVVRAPDGEISLDLKGKKSGRGAYICQNISCLKKARKGKRIERALECEISDDIYTALEAQLLESDSKGEAQ